VVAKERILVVDDEEDVRGLVSRMVGQIGYEVKVARQGTEALEILRREVFTLLITDIQMPGMDGLALTKAVRSEFPQASVICMTGHGPAYSFSDVVACGAADYITKPFQFDELKAKLDRVILEKHLIENLTQKSLELERANQELKRLDQLKSTFISSVSHELRTPLTVIKEFISLMLEGHLGPVTEDQKEYLGISQKNILRLTNLIENLLDFSRIESGKGLRFRFEPVRLAEVVDEISLSFSQQLNEKNITLENRLDPDGPLVLVDRNRIAEVFVNLIGNGIKFTPSGGKITVDSRGLTEKRDYLKVIVSDTGVGIASEDLPQVFDRFYQGQRTQHGIVEGTGLGLAITKEILEGHRGIIQAESRFGSGASFLFTLPLFGGKAIFSLLIQLMQEEADKDQVPLSFLQVLIQDQWTKREFILDREKWEGVLYALKKMVRSVDQTIPYQNHKVYILSHIDRRLAEEIGERIQAKLTSGGYVPKGTDVQFKVLTYSREGLSRDEFLRECHTVLKED
jgi:signal transduction histidine kinase